MKDLEAVIGLEIHAQMATATKMFCRCDNDSFNKQPNTNVCPVCMGFPGQLPVLNKEAVEKGVKAALALNCEIPATCKFDRKNYFYPDNPKGFQISQYDEPISKNGFVDVGEKRIGITRLHLEDDAGKLTHVKDGSLVDFNRSGTPLMEIVSEPDMRNSAEACAYAKEIQKIVRYTESSDADMEKGMMRFDASVSLRPKGETKLYPRSEIKNLNSFKSLEASIDYEIKRQGELWAKGEAHDKPITVGWDEEKGKTFFMREKEESDDYRYFPEPDIPPLNISEEMVKKFKAEIPELPSVRMARYVSDLGLSEDDARILTSEVKLAKYFDSVVEICSDAKKAAAFITTVLMKHMNEGLISVDEQKVSAKMMGELIEMINSGEISNNVAKGEVFEEMYDAGKSPAEIVKEKGLTQISDMGAIEEACKTVVDANPGPAEDVKNGKEKAIGFLVGMVMKEMKGQANPQMVNEVLRKVLGL